jgi:hypothetical protein
VAAGKNGNEGTLDDDVLAENDRGRRFVGTLHALGRRLQAGNDVRRFCEGAHDAPGSLLGCFEVQLNKNMNKNDHGLGSPGQVNVTLDWGKGVTSPKG